ncbi:MAG: hypothetical protein Q4G60_13105 [bacterium]|nr:hypothetical protein [bacterium]
MSEEKKELQDVELTEEQKAAIEAANKEATKIGEIFSQCWESEDFRKNFKEHPKEVLKEYGVTYDESKDYIILDSPAKTVTYVLPYENVKQGMQVIADGLMRNVSSVEDETPKQIIPEGWAIQILQNTEDTCYMVIPVSPEDLTPEELELVNGGCFIGFFVSVVIWLVAGVAVAVGFMAVAALAAVALLAIGVVVVGFAVVSAVTVAT